MKRNVSLYLAAVQSDKGETMAREQSLSNTAHRLGLTYAEAYRLVLTHRLKGRRDGRSWLVTEESIAAYEQTRAAAAIEIPAAV